MTNDVTIFIPTYNRPQMLLRTVSFLQRDTPQLPIIVADGSEALAASQNEELCRKSGPNIDYFYLPSPSDYDGSTKNYLRRFNVALDRVKTPYVACCADDDLLLPKTAVTAADFLARNPDYVGCQGTYLTFRYAGDHLRIDGKVYDGPSIDGEEVGSRLMQFYSRYEAPYYAVFRTPVQRFILQNAQDISNPMLLETFHSAAVVIQGKLKRLNNIYYLRNIGVAPHGRPVEGWNSWMAKDLDDVFEHYQIHRAKIIDLMSSSGNLRIDLQSLRRAIDMSFIIYVGREFHMEYWIEEYLKTAVADQKERNRLRRSLNARLLSFHSPYPTLGGAIKTSIKTIINKTLGEKGMKLARRMVDPTAIVPLPQNSAIRLSEALLSGFPDADWDALSRRVSAD